MKQLNIPLLEAADIDCRVQSVSKTQSGKVGAILLLYKDARVDMRILDQVFGPFGWQRTHEIVNGNLFCAVDIWDEDNRCWVRKQDVGVESNTEKEKGQASDSFKRACFNIGIGRELYSSPFIYVELRDGEYFTDQQGKTKCSAKTKFRVSDIGYNERREINRLEIVDIAGNVRYKLGAKTPARATQPAQEPPKQQQPVNNTPVQQTTRAAAQNANPEQCPVCGGKITSAEKDFSMKRYGSVMCRACQNKQRS